MEVKNILSVEEYKSGEEEENISEKILSMKNKMLGGEGREKLQKKI
jgi:hypothetical protein